MHNFSDTLATKWKIKNKFIKLTIFPKMKSFSSSYMILMMIHYVSLYSMQLSKSKMNSATSSKIRFCKLNAGIR